MAFLLLDSGSGKNMPSRWLSLLLLLTGLLESTDAKELERFYVTSYYYPADVPGKNFCAVNEDHDVWTVFNRNVVLWKNVNDSLVANVLTVSWQLLPKVATFVMHLRQLSPSRLQLIIQEEGEEGYSYLKVWFTEWEYSFAPNTLSLAGTPIELQSNDGQPVGAIYSRSIQVRPDGQMMYLWGHVQRGAGYNQRLSRFELEPFAFLDAVEIHSMLVKPWNYQLHVDWDHNYAIAHDNMGPLGRKNMLFLFDASNLQLLHNLTLGSWVGNTGRSETEGSVIDPRLQVIYVIAWKWLYKISYAGRRLEIVKSLFDLSPGQNLHTILIHPELQYLDGITTGTSPIRLRRMRPAS